MTDNEARRYGRFLHGLLETVMTWHSDCAVFEAECANYPGFLTVFRNASSSASSSNKQEPLDYENFRHVCHKWHYKLTKSFIVCLESEEYLQMRNSLIILTKILPFYPKLTAFCSALEKRVDKIKQVEKEKRQDIFTLASAYQGLLKQRKHTMVDESKFHLKEQVDKNKSEFKQPMSTTNGTKPNTVSSQTKKEAVSVKKETNQTNGKSGNEKPASPKKIEDSKLNGNSSSTKVSSKRPSASPVPLTPTKNGNAPENPDYSPTSSVSSDDLPVSSPRRIQHSRSQSPSQSGVREQKVKRVKTEDVNITKAKSSRERDRIESKDSGKKEHRKREHSNDLSEVQHKRSKSDEKSKKTSSSSSSQSSSQQSQSSSKRSSKKHDEEYSSSSQSSNQGSQSKKSDDKHRDERRTSSSSSYYKDKK